MNKKMRNIKQLRHVVCKCKPNNSKQQPNDEVFKHIGKCVLLTLVGSGIGGILGVAITHNIYF